MKKMYKLLTVMLSTLILLSMTGFTREAREARERENAPPEPASGNMDSAVQGQSVWPVLKQRGFGTGDTIPLDFEYLLYGGIDSVDCQSDGFTVLKPPKIDAANNTISVHIRYDCSTDKPFFTLLVQTKDGSESRAPVYGYGGAGGVFLAGSSHRDAEYLYNEANNLPNPAPFTPSNVCRNSNSGTQTRGTITGVFTWQDDYNYTTSVPAVRRTYPLKYAWVAIFVGNAIRPEEETETDEYGQYSIPIPDEPNLKLRVFAQNLPRTVNTPNTAFENVIKVRTDTSDQVYYWETSVSSSTTTVNNRLPRKLI